VGAEKWLGVKPPERHLKRNHFSKGRVEEDRDGDGRQYPDNDHDSIVSRLQTSVNSGSALW